MASQMPRDGKLMPLEVGKSSQVAKKSRGRYPERGLGLESIGIEPASSLASFRADTPSRTTPYGAAIPGARKSSAIMNILLVHGLGRSPLSFFGLAGCLRRAGHHTHFFGYSPALETVPHITRRLAGRLRAMSHHGRPIGAVGHSLGGLLIRMVLPSLPDLPIHHLVMLGTPNRSSRLARRASKWAPFRWFNRDCARLLASAEAVAAIPVPSVPYTLIAGTAGPCGRASPFGDDPNDGVVAVDELPIHAADQPLLFPVWHTLMMNDRLVKQAILAAFSTRA